MNRLGILTAIAAVALLTGCATTHADTAKRPTPTFSAYAGMDANKLAAHVTGCKDVAASDVGAGSQSGLTSAATCQLDGHSVYFASWSSADEADLSALFGHDGSEMYWAQGDIWAAFINDDPTARQQVTNDTTGLLSGDQTPVNADAAKSVAEAVVKYLGGRVAHAGS